MRCTTRRCFLRTAAACGALAMGNATLTAAEPDRKKPRERSNILYALSTGSWGRVIAPGQPLALLQVLDETAAAGYNGVRITGFPDMLARNGMSVDQFGAELARRGLRFSTVSFGGQYHDAEAQPEIRQRARQALAAHKQFGATAMVFFPPSPAPADQEAEVMRRAFSFMNELGKMALEEFGVRMGLHNHTGALIENQAQVDRFLEGTDPRYVFCAWDSAHLLLGGCDVLATYKKSIDRLVYTDFKDATLAPSTADYLSPNGEKFAGDSPQGKFFNAIYELGRGQIDFPALMRLLKQNNYRGWINHDIDTIRVSIPDSLQVSMKYIESTLDPIYQ